MNDLISLEKIAQWQKLKTLVLDSVSSPITKRVYNMALDEFMGWFQDRRTNIAFTSTSRTLYPRLAGLANEWNGRMGIDERYPDNHASFLKRGHDAGQTRPTPLLLQYVPGDFNCLHQDLYGDLAFPIQVAILLSEPGKDFTGGEFVLTEQRPRMQSRAEVVPLG